MSSAACGSSSAGEAPSSWQREASKLRGWKDHVPLRVESLDWRCGAQVIGTVCEALPRFDGALAAHAIPRTRVLGVWTVPPPLLRHLDGGHAPWADVRPRLGPFVDSWPQLRRLSDRAAREPRDGGRGGAAAAGFDEAEWQAMGLLGENLLLVKHTLRPAQLAAQLSRRIRRQLATRRQLAKRLLREHPFLRPATAALLLRRALRRERLLRRLANLWPFQWRWLALYLCSSLLLTCISCISFISRSSPKVPNGKAPSVAMPELAPSTTHWILIHLMVLSYWYVSRAAPEGALTDAARAQREAHAELRNGRWQVGRTRKEPQPKCPKQHKKFGPFPPTCHTHTLSCVSTDSFL